MNWEMAENKITEVMTEGMDLNTSISTWRKVAEILVDGYRVQIGAKYFMNIDWGMLQKCWEQLYENGEYDGEIFGKLYPKLRSQHGCYVHVVGQIFVRAGFADCEGRTYRYIPH